MKKKLMVMLCCLTLTFGFVVYNLYLRHETIEISGSIAAMSKIQLIDSASVITMGRVEEILPSKWVKPDEIKIENRNIIQTDILIKLEEVYKGIPYNEKTIKVRIAGGTVGNTTMIFNGFPNFNVGEEVILFLSEDDGDLATDEDYYLVTGMLQGKFTLNDDSKDNNTFINGTQLEELNRYTVQKEITERLEELKINPLPK